MIRTVGLAWITLAVYGFCLGVAHSELYALRNLIKFPLLVSVTALVCGLAWWIVARASGMSVSFLRVQRVAWGLFADLGLLLVSLAPVVLFLALVLRASDDGRLGEYDLFLSLNVGAIAVCGSIALARQTRELVKGTDFGSDRERVAGPERLVECHRRSDAAANPRGRAYTVVGLWLVLTAAVGGQAAFYMRPFFGFPATRGARPPFFLGSERDLRGATNFYEAVLQTIQRPPLEAPWLSPYR